MTHLVQISVILNHQNGRDTHIRQIKLFAPKTNPYFEDRALREPATRDTTDADEDAEGQREPTLSCHEYQQYSVLR